MPASNAGVKTTRGAGRYFLAGFSLDGADVATTGALSFPDFFPKFFDNLLE
jgi:hypothetical protein